MDADTQLEKRLAQMETELSLVAHSLAQKDVELDRLHSQVEEATREAQREAEQRSQALEERLSRETESSILRAEVEKLRALEELREEHKRAMDSERKLMDDWMQDVKERFSVEKQHLEECISMLEMAVRPHVPGSASGSSTHVHRSASRSDDLYPTNKLHEFEISELSDGSEGKAS